MKNDKNYYSFSTRPLFFLTFFLSFSLSLLPPILHPFPFLRSNIVEIFKKSIHDFMKSESSPLRLFIYSFIYSFIYLLPLEGNFVRKNAKCKIARFRSIITGRIKIRMEIERGFDSCQFQSY